MGRAASLLSPREELLAIQKEIFRRNQRLIEDSISIQEKGFEAYQREYRRHVTQFEHVSTKEELLEAILAADIIYVGDYHTNAQAQRGFLRILKMLIEKTDRFVVALELIHKRYQSAIDQFLAGESSEREFLEEIKLKRRWYFDLWPNFQPIFDFSKYHHLKIYGVESAHSMNSTLKSRDLACAQRLAEISKQHPGHKLLVFIGDLHISPEHLPADLKSLQKPHDAPKKELIIFQNSEQIYWKLASMGLEEKTEIVRIDETSFCLTNTPPIVWQQSYINWLEHEEGEIDFPTPSTASSSSRTGSLNSSALSSPPRRKRWRFIPVGI
jgi:uncharacterized iron-regulated protein